MQYWKRDEVIDPGPGGGRLKATGPERGGKQRMVMLFSNGSPPKTTKTKTTAAVSASKDFVHRSKSDNGPAATSFSSFLLSLSKAHYNEAWLTCFDGESFTEAAV